MFKNKERVEVRVSWGSKEKWAKGLIDSMEPETSGEFGYVCVLDLPGRAGAASIPLCDVRKMP